MSEYSINGVHCYPSLSSFSGAATVCEARSDVTSLHFTPLLLLSHLFTIRIIFLRSFIVSSVNRHIKFIHRDKTLQKKKKKRHHS